VANVAKETLGNYLEKTFIEGDLNYTADFSGKAFGVALGAATVRAAQMSKAAGAEVVEETAINRGQFLREKYSYMSAEQRASRIEELSTGNRILREAGVPREYISEALQSFEPGTIRNRIAGENDYGLRLYGGVSGPKSPYVGPTFPLGDARSLNAAVPGNTLKNIAQWQIKPGTTLLEGRIRANFGQPGGGIQMYVPDFRNNLLTPEKF